MRLPWLPLAAVIAFATPAVADTPTGVELTLHGPNRGYYDRTVHLRGNAYEVWGAARLTAAAGAVVRARHKLGAWVETHADAQGFFVVDVPIPEEAAGLQRDDDTMLEVEVRARNSTRTFTFPFTAEAPWLVDLVADRQLYQPGETVHVWMRVRDAVTHRPAPGLEVNFGSITVKTGESGVASMDVQIPKEENEGTRSIEAVLGPLRKRVAYRIGTRAMERLFAEVKVTPEIAHPGEALDVMVHVTAPSGAPVRGATASATLGEKQQITGLTDAEGVAHLALHAPAYVAEQTGSAQIVVNITHPAYGSVVAHGRVDLAAPLALDVEAVTPNGGLVPFVASKLYVKIADTTGKPAGAGIEVEASGAAIASGKQTAKTDAHGIAVVPVLLQDGAAARTDSDAAGRAVTTVTIRVQGPLARVAAMQIPVLSDVEVVPVVARPVVAPGDDVVVALAYRQGARAPRAVVELLDGDGIVQTAVTTAGQKSVTLKVPPDRIGVMQVRARPLLEKGVAEGTGGVDVLLVRPAHPIFAEIKADRDRYDVRQTAHLTLVTPPGATHAWAAVLVRDLAAHAGETPFRLPFLTQAFERAVLDPQSGAAETLLRTALAAYLAEDTQARRAPELLDALGKPLPETEGLEVDEPRGIMRDPFPLADELRRRGLAETMRRIEAELARALDEGRLGELTTGKGGARRFRPTLLHDLSPDDPPRTLGDGELTVDMITEVDPSFTYDNVARRVARVRLVKLLVALAGYLDPGDQADPAARAAAREPSGRWLARMVQRGLVRPEDLLDPWGGRFALRPGKPQLIAAAEAVGLELASAGPDGVWGTADDVRDVFARAVPAGTPYAVASGEDVLMEKISYLSPGEAVLLKLLEAYTRLPAELEEEQRGQAVAAEISEGEIGLGAFGTVGHGSGGGAGYGMGSGSGAVHGHITSTPKVSIGSARMSGLAQVLREQFPPTLKLFPAIPLDPSGKTTFDLALPDAVTTFIVEAVVWTGEGWTWSSDAKLRVEKELVVDAPVPSFATVGDVVRMPARAQNRGAKDAEVTVAIAEQTGDAAPQQNGAPSPLRVPAGDAAVASIAVTLEHPGDERVLIALEGRDGKPLDAVRRPITVLPLARRVRHTEELLASGTQTLTIDVPDGATPSGGSQLDIVEGRGLFPDDPQLSVTMLAADPGDPSLYARTLAAAWLEAKHEDALLAHGVTALAAVLAKADLATQSVVLTALAPAARLLGARTAVRGDLESLLRGLRKSVSDGIAAVKDDPLMYARAAAGLATTAPPGADLSLPRELVRRARRHELRVGDDVWIAAPGMARGAATALLALAEAELGERQAAFELVRTLARAAQDRSMQPDVAAWAAAAVDRLTQGARPEALTVTIDGHATRVPLREGVGGMATPSLSTPGRHEIRVEAPAGDAPVFVRAFVEYGVPWDRPAADPAHLAPALTVSIEGAPKKRDEREKMEIVVQNRSPRTIGRPVLEISLPAGAELDQEVRGALRGLVAADPDATRGTLRLELGALPPGTSRKIPLALRWTVAGSLHGLGVAAFPSDQPEEISITPPRVWEVTE